MNSVLIWFVGSVRIKIEAWGAVSSDSSSYILMSGWRIAPILTVSLVFVEGRRSLGH